MPEQTYDTKETAQYLELFQTQPGSVMTKTALRSLPRCLCRNPEQRKHSRGTNWLLGQAEKIPSVEAFSKAKLHFFRDTPSSHQTMTTFGYCHSRSCSQGRSMIENKYFQHKPKPAFKSKFSLSRKLGCKSLLKQMFSKLHEFTPISVNPYRHGEMSQYAHAHSITTSPCTGDTRPTRQTN